MKGTVLRLLERNELFRNRMVRHKQSGDDFTLEDVPFHNFRYVGF